MTLIYSANRHRYKSKLQMLLHTHARLLSLSVPLYASSFVSGRGLSSIHTHTHTHTHYIHTSLEPYKLFLVSLTHTSHASARFSPGPPGKRLVALWPMSKLDLFALFSHIVHVLIFNLAHFCDWHRINYVACTPLCDLLSL